MKKKILFIINPISGVGRQQRVEQLLKKHLNTAYFDSEIVYTQAAKHAIELSKQAVKEQFDMVAAVGGDGSVNEVGQGLINTPAILAIVPCGSGNGAARNLSISTNLRKAINTLNACHVKTIDTFTVNNHPVINVAGVGFAAYVSQEFSKKKQRGFLNYLKIALSDAIHYPAQPCTLSCNGSTQPLNIFIMDIANGAQWGNQVMIAPQAQADDGWLDVCIIKDFPRMYLPVMAMRLFMKNIHHSKYVATIRTKELTIHQTNDYAHIDGEAYSSGHALVIKINPQSLRVIHGGV
jgi:diacylglycerol kinase (ATP)